MPPSTTWLPTMTPSQAWRPTRRPRSRRTRSRSSRHPRAVPLATTMTTTTTGAAWSWRIASAACAVCRRTSLAGPCGSTWRTGGRGCMPPWSDGSWCTPSAADARSPSCCSCSRRPSCRWRRWCCPCQPCQRQRRRPRKRLQHWRWRRWRRSSWAARHTMAARVRVDDVRAPAQASTCCRCHCHCHSSSGRKSTAAREMPRSTTAPARRQVAPRAPCP